MAANTGYGDAALWQASAVGEHAAFGQLFDRHATAVTSLGSVRLTGLTARVVASSQLGTIYLTGLAGSASRAR